MHTDTLMTVLLNEYLSMQLYVNVHEYVVFHMANTGATAFTDAFFGQGDGPIQLDVYSCVGTESRLEDCSYDSNQAGCLRQHAQDAGVRCNEGIPSFRLSLALPPPTLE